MTSTPILGSNEQHVSDDDHPCHRAGCEGTCQWVGDDAAGQYEKWRCNKCGRVTWTLIPLWARGR